MELTTPIWDYIEDEYTNMPLFLMDRLDSKDYDLLNANFVNGKAIKANNKEVTNWYKIHDSIYSECFVDCGHVILSVNGYYWWGTTENILSIGALTIWDILTKIREKDRILASITNEE